MNAFAALYGVVLRRQTSRTRLIVLLVLTALAAALGLAMSRSALSFHEVVEVVAEVGLRLAVPIITLILASPAIGEWLEDETLVYVWLRPISRWTIVLGALGATLTVAVPANLLTTGTVAAIASGFDPKVMGATFVSVTLGTLAYGSLFVLLGAVTKRALVAGLGYVFIWESLIASFGDGLARLSVRSYAVSALSRLSRSDVYDAPLALGGRGPVSTYVVPLVVLVAGAAATVWILDHKDVP